MIIQAYILFRVNSTSDMWHTEYNSLPMYDHDNIFALTEVNNHVIVTEIPKDTRI